MACHCWVEFTLHLRAFFLQEFLVASHTAFVLGWSSAWAGNGWKRIACSSSRTWARRTLMRSFGDPWSGRLLLDSSRKKPLKARLASRFENWLVVFTLLRHAIGSSEQICSEVLTQTSGATVCLPKIRTWRISWFQGLQCWQRSRCSMLSKWNLVTTVRVQRCPLHIGFVLRQRYALVCCKMLFEHFRRCLRAWHDVNHECAMELLQWWCSNWVQVLHMEDFTADHVHMVMHACMVTKRLCKTTRLRLYNIWGYIFQTQKAFSTDICLYVIDKNREIYTVYISK